MKVLIAGGGTGGHIYPALAIADALCQAHGQAEVLFVGARGRMEMEKVPQAGYPIIGLPVAGIIRRVTWRNLLVPFQLLWSLWLSWTIIRRFRPDVAVGVGGYASGPALRVAGWMGIPTVLQEQNSYAGITNRMLASRAVRICVAWPGMERFFPLEKLVFTGNPLRHQIVQSGADPAAARRAMGLEPNRPTILLLGGSLGAPSLNQAVMAHHAYWQSTSPYQLIWQCGKAHLERCAAHPVAQLPAVRLLPFIQDMGQAYAAADIIIARAGALTIAELCQVGKPAILVPSPWVAEDHQTSNARSLEAQGAAVLLADKEAETHLFEVAAQLMEDSERRRAMSSAISALARPDAAQAVAAVLTEIVKPLA